MKNFRKICQACLYVSFGLWRIVQAFLNQGNAAIRSFTCIMMACLILCCLIVLRHKTKQIIKKKSVFSVCVWTIIQASVIETNHLLNHDNPWNTQSSILIILALRRKFIKNTNKSYDYILSSYIVIRTIAEMCLTGNFYLLESLQTILILTGLYPRENMEPPPSLAIHRQPEAKYQTSSNNIYNSLSKTGNNQKDEKLSSDYKQHSVDKSNTPIIREPFKAPPSQRQNDLDLTNVRMKEEKVMFAQLLENLLNNFQEGIIILDNAEKVQFMNNKCEKLFGVTGEFEIINLLKTLILKANIVSQVKSFNQPGNHGQIEDRLKDLQKNPSVDNLFKIIFEYNATRNIQQSINQSFLNTSFFQVESSKNQVKLSCTHQVGKDYKDFHIKLVQGFVKEEGDDYQHLIMEAKPILLIIIKNITRQRQIKELITECDFKTQLLQSFSHELRTPLNCSIQLLSVASEMSRENLELSKLIRQSSQQNQLLIYQINDILDFASLESDKFTSKLGKVTLHSIAEQLRKIYQEGCDEKVIKFSVIDNTNIDEIITDGDRLMQVIVNLMNNSLKFTPQNGVIQLILDQITPTKISVLVKDDGIGISEERLGLIQEYLSSGFQYGFQNKVHKQKVGIGLVLSNRLIQKINQKGGRQLTIESSSGKGTQISFYVEELQDQPQFIISPSQQILDKDLSVFDEPEISDGCSSNISYHTNRFKVPDLPCLMFQQMRGTYITASSPKESNKNYLRKFNSDTLKVTINNKYQTSREAICNHCKNILIVDDIPFNHIALKAMLKNLKLDCDQAYDGNQAVELVKVKTQQHCGSYKIILMDIEMPGMNGFDTTKRVQNFSI